jgi:AraC-like DNA-binding protein
MSVCETPARNPVLRSMPAILDVGAACVLNESDTFRKTDRARVNPDMSAATDGVTYREYRPPAALGGIVECFWRRERWRPPDGDLGVLPDGRVDVIWAGDGEVVVAGPQRRPLGRPLPPELVVVGVRFPLGIGPPLLGVPAHELADMHVSLAAIDARPAALLLRDLASIEDSCEAPARIARAVARRVDSYWSPDPVVRWAAALLADPRARVEGVADELALSERLLQRRFREFVGYGPKTLQRVLRFQRLLGALELGRDQTGGLARIAATIGYSDQAHLTRETRELSGHSPVSLERALGALKDERASGVFKTGQRGRGGARGIS